MDQAAEINLHLLDTGEAVALLTVASPREATADRIHCTRALDAL